jgi:hypothetical protein
MRFRSPTQKRRDLTQVDGADYGILRDHVRDSFSARFSK